MFGRSCQKWINLIQSEKKWTCTGPPRIWLWSIWEGSDEEKPNDANRGDGPDYEDQKQWAGGLSKATEKEAPFDEPSDVLMSLCLHITAILWACLELLLLPVFQVLDVNNKQTYSIYLSLQKMKSPTASEIYSLWSSSWKYRFVSAS